ncbi:MAG: 5-formyltetrahydrofolate cyclo-ligase [Thermoproteota archaeon]
MEKRKIFVKGLDIPHMDKTKQEIREETWRKMEKLRVALFPGAFGKIPNFIGAEKAALRLTQLDEWKRATVVKVNPDSPQTYVRKLALVNSMILIMPTPRLRNGFLLLDPRKLDKKDYSFASTIKGAFVYGVKTNSVDLPKIDLVVAGSVTVNEQGDRIGKGGGYSEVEWAVAREHGKVDEDTPIVTTIHDVQLVKEEFEVAPYDLPLDYIVTPSKTIRIHRSRKKPEGIYWNLISPEKIMEIPILQEMFKRKTQV